MGAFTATGGVIDETKTADDLGGLLRLFGVDSIVGRAVVLHAGDDSCSGASGDAGARLAGCVIGLRQEVETGANAVVQAAAVAPFTPTQGVGACAHDGIHCIREAVAVLQPLAACADAVTGSAVVQCRRGALGVVRFSAGQLGGVRVVAKVHGLARKHGASSAFGFHVHTYGDLSDYAGGGSVGPHLDPYGTGRHDVPFFAPRHMGDMGNLKAYDPSDGSFQYESNVPLLELDKLIGRAVVVHAGRDRGSGHGCDSAGSSGTKIAWGVIGIAHENSATYPPPVITATIDNNFGEHRLRVALARSGSGDLCAAWLWR